MEKKNTFYLHDNISLLNIMYAIAFDMVVAYLKEYYGESYRNAYFEIKTVLREYEFYNTQM